MGKPWGNGFPAWAIHHSPELEALEPDLGFPLNAVPPEPQPRLGCVLGRPAASPPATRRARSATSPTPSARSSTASATTPASPASRSSTRRGRARRCSRAPALPAGCPLVDAYVQATWQRITDRIRAGGPRPARVVGAGVDVEPHRAEPPRRAAADPGHRRPAGGVRVPRLLRVRRALDLPRLAAGAPADLRRPPRHHLAERGDLQGPHRPAAARDRVRQHRRRRRARALAPPVRRRLHGLAVLALRRRASGSARRRPSRSARTSSSTSPAPTPAPPPARRSTCRSIRPPARCGTRYVPRDLGVPTEIARVGRPLSAGLRRRGHRRPRGRHAERERSSWSTPTPARPRRGRRPPSHRRRAGDDPGHRSPAGRRRAPGDRGHGRLVAVAHPRSLDGGR